MRFAYLTVFFVLASHWGWAQGSYRAGILPQVQLTSSVFSNWKINLRAEPRQILSEGRFPEQNGVNYRHERVDFTGLLTTGTGLNSSAGAGYMLRVEDRELIHRLIQQYSVVAGYTVFRTGHRLVTDQTFRRNEPVELRLRYRFSVEMPLSGQTVDPNEPYLKLNNEYLLILQRQAAADLETRFVGVLGWNFSDRNKLETGVDYRVNDFTGGPGRHQFWLYLGWFVTLKR